MLYAATTAIASTTTCAPWRCTIRRLSAGGIAMSRVLRRNEGQNVAKKRWGKEREPGACELDDVCLLFGIQLHVETGLL